MNRMKKLLMVGVALSSLGAAGAAHQHWNGANSNMDENTSQTGSDESQNVVVIPSDSFVTTETTPDSVLQNQLQSAETPGAPELPVDNPSQAEPNPIQPAQSVTPPEHHYESHSSDVTFDQ